MCEAFVYQRVTTIEGFSDLLGALSKYGEIVGTHKTRPSAAAALRLMYIYLIKPGYPT